MNQTEKTGGVLFYLRQERTILLVAGVCGLLAVILGWYLLHEKEQELGDRIEVLVAKANILKGELFTEENLTRQSIPQKFINPRAIEYSEQNQNIIIDRRAAIDIPVNQQLTWEFVEVVDAQTGLSDQLNKDERAVTMLVNEMTGLAGHLRPNDRVDLVGTFVLPGKDDSRGNTTKTILQCVTVLAVGEHQASAGPGEEGYSSVTLKVSATEAALLTFAESIGNLRLLLRNRDDLEVRDDLPEIGMGKFFEIEKEYTQQRKIRLHQNQPH